MEIGWTDVGSGGYILVSCAHSNTRYLYNFLKEIYLNANDLPFQGKKVLREVVGMQFTYLYLGGGYFQTCTNTSN
jgi:hypothetical protein